MNNIASIPSGQSVLFLGAGFSHGIKNISGGKFPSSNELKEKLEQLLDVENSGQDIDALANILIEDNEYDVNSLITMLEHNFKIGKNENLEIHEQILKLPWKRIYTVNYDDVVETISGNIGINRKSITLNQRVKDNINKNLIIHLNGSINNLTNSTLLSEFKLSSTSYLQTDLVNSEWYDVFKSDIDTAKNVFFLGVSMNYDLDISRVLVNEDDYKEKIFFIDKFIDEDVKKSKQFKIKSHKQTKFGTLYPIGLQKFSEHLTSNISELINENDFTFSCLSEFHSEEREVMASPSIELRDLLVFGSVKEGYISTNTDNYLVHRDVENKIYDNLKNEKYLVHLLIGQMANGKTSIINNLKYRLLNIGKVFVYNKYNANFKSELEHLKKIPGKKFIFIENYYKYLDLLKDFRALLDFKQDRIILILSGRPFPNESVQNLLPEKIGLDADYFQEYSEELDTLTNTDVKKFDQLLSKANFLEAERMDPNFDPVRYYKTHFKLQIYNILIDLVKNKVVHEELKENYTIIRDTEELENLTIASCICTVIGFKITLTNLLEILGISKSILSIKGNRQLNLFMDFSNQSIQNKSSILANLVLSEFNTPNQVLEILKKLIVNSNRSTDEAVTRNILHDGISSSNIYSLIYPLGERAKKLKSDRKHVIEFYNEIKDLPELQSNVFFWVQFSMACMDFKDYDRAFSNLDVAKTIVDTKKECGKFLKDSIQVITQNARCNLENAIYVKNIVNPYELLKITHIELYQLITSEEKTKHYLVYKIMRLYVDFYNIYKKEFSIEQKKKYASLINDLTKRISKYKAENQFLGDRNKQMLESILRKFNKMLPLVYTDMMNDD